MGGERYWDISDIIKDIKKFPQTYKSILGEDYDNGTAQLLIRKKLNRLVKEGEICKTAIPGTRFGKCLFYSDCRTYYILVEAGRVRSQVYCFFEYKNLNRFFMSVDACWLLRDEKWVKCYNKRFFNGKVLLFI